MIQKDYAMSLSAALRAVFVAGPVALVYMPDLRHEMPPRIRLPKE
jgi:hypothetical protein